jgi:hypothetical protein
MSLPQKLSPRDKLKIQRLYAKGLKPSEISAELASLNLTPRQVTQFLFKRGWTKRRSEIEEVRQQTAAEIFRSVRTESLKEFQSVLRTFAASLTDDSEQLAHAWKLVEDAAGASSLMRAKSLHLDQALRFHGLDKTDATEAQTKPDLRLFFFNEPVRRVCPLPESPSDSKEVPALIDVSPPSPRGGE